MHVGTKGNVKREHQRSSSKQEEQGTLTEEERMRVCLWGEWPSDQRDCLRDKRPGRRRLRRRGVGADVKRGGEGLGVLALYS